ncbi:MAG: T9SS type A sorting domain-containing protein [Bacteroidetes bacterium]|nr:T9SS type A sorting domain-containing protein [Bacteroidota bacterium]MBK9524333.1 T9SS type A sorting domain-containing protein [Bacteroidota bacterium]MBK9543595.1 T9SS type A sorting domain-containing protein [Bacteroidota bacterium]MBP6401316.1 T9SS type A sorting domain-containing protein [Bacteroidia bacterium]MBP6647957.1 T9SS type A sorting domain-containing protein [Bacteroidia bacterium]
MKYIYASWFVLFCCYGTCIGQPVIEWQKCFGGTWAEDGTSIYETPDGGFVIAGEARSQDGDVSGVHANAPFGTSQNPDFWIIKIDSLGNLQWQKCLGGTEFDEPSCIKATPDGGYIVGGYTLSNDGDVTGFHPGGWDFWLLKLDSYGNLEWQKCYGGSGSENLRDLLITEDDGILLLGDATSTDYDVHGLHGLADIWLVKTDNAGNLLWQKCYGGSGTDVGYSIKQTADGGFIIAGETSSADGDMTLNNGSSDYCLLKIDSVGNLLWQKSYGGSRADWATNVIQDFSRGYILSGGTFSNDSDVSGNHGNADFWVIRTDSIGNLDWQKCFGGSSDDRACALIKANDGNFITIGPSISIDGNVNGNRGLNCWLVKFDASGNIIWNNCYGGHSTQAPRSIIQHTDGGLAFAAIAYGNDGDVTGNHSPGFGDMWIVKLTNGIFSSISKPEILSSKLIFPNPVHNSMSISLSTNECISIYNELGEIIQPIYFSTCVIGKNELDVSALLPGVYFIRIGDEIKKFIKE